MPAVGKVSEGLSCIFSGQVSIEMADGSTRVAAERLAKNKSSE